MSIAQLAVLSFLGICASVWLVKRFVVRNPLDNIPGPPSPSFWTGHLRLLFSNHPGLQFQREISDKYGRVVLLKSELGARVPFIADPRALHTIAVKEQDVFEETDIFIQNNAITFGQGLLATLGEQHRRQRKVITPVFSMKHLRELVPIFNGVSQKLKDRIAEDVTGGEAEVDMLRWLSRTALELIGTGGLGYSFNALEGDDHPYTVAIKQFGPVGFKLLLPRRLVPFFKDLMSPSMWRKLVELTPWPVLHQMLSITDAMWRTTEEIYNGGVECKDTLMQDAERNSIMTVLKKANSNLSSDERLSEYEIKSQINTLVLAANETTSRTISKILHTLALHPEAQERLRAEVAEARVQHGDLDYDQLNALPYLDAVMRETLRLHAPVSMLARICRKDTILPLLDPISGRDGAVISELFIPRGTEIQMGIWALQTDRTIWGPDAHEWKPDRWLAALPDTVERARIPGVLSNQMTFLAGSRSCIGFKFAQLEIKAVLVVLLSHFKFSPSSRDSEIEWVFSGLIVPKVKGESNPQLPLRVSLLS